MHATKGFAGIDLIDRDRDARQREARATAAAVTRHVDVPIRTKVGHHFSELRLERDRHVALGYVVVAKGQIANAGGRCFHETNGVRELPREGPPYANVVLPQRAEHGLVRTAGEGHPSSRGGERADDHAASGARAPRTHDTLVASPDGSEKEGCREGGEEAIDARGRSRRGGVSAR